MNIINKIAEKSYNEYYKDIYMGILNNCKEKENILVINQNYFNPLKYFSHFFKKFSLQFYIFFKNTCDKEKYCNEAKGEELVEKIFCDFSNLQELNKLTNFIKFSKIILFHIKSEEYLNILLELIYPLISENGSIYIYISLGNKKSKMQSKIRSFINNNSFYNISNVLNNDTFFNNLHDNKYFSIDAIKIFKDNYYAIYGENTVYEIILVKK
tara:strand:+ start:128 stop:763 length:636 start_codon:yes stop_codon:yes gene_type:complete